jgi:hypothetical protein
MLVSWGFIFLKIVYTQFHLDETSHLSFFINSLSCHQKIICDNLFIENETPIKSSTPNTQHEYIDVRLYTPMCACRVSDSCILWIGVQDSVVFA